jgi:hypothetical protein
MLLAAVRPGFLPILTPRLFDLLRTRSCGTVACTRLRWRMSARATTRPSAACCTLPSGQKPSCPSCWLLTCWFCLCSDVSDDVRRAAVTSIGFVLANHPDQVSRQLLRLGSPADPLFNFAGPQNREPAGRELQQQRPIRRLLGRWHCVRWHRSVPLLNRWLSLLTRVVGSQATRTL